MNLKHGELNVNLKICTKAQRAAALQFEIDNGISFDKAIGLTTGFGEYLVLYAYHSYVIWCKMNVEVQKYDIYEFDELITKRGVVATESNLEAVFEELTNTIISSITESLPEDKKKELAEKNLASKLG